MFDHVCWMCVVKCKFVADGSIFSGLTYPASRSIFCLQFAQLHPTILHTGAPQCQRTWNFWLINFHPFWACSSTELSGCHHIAIRVISQLMEAKMPRYEIIEVSPGLHPQTSNPVPCQVRRGSLAHQLQSFARDVRAGAGAGPGASSVTLGAGGSIAVWESELFQPFSGIARKLSWLLC